MQPTNQLKIIRLPPSGPKPGQSMESWLRGKAQGDRRWQRIKDRNIGRLIQPSRKTSEFEPQ